jgi:hypothetical protein
MKKLFALMMVASFALAFVACGGKKDESAKKTADSLAAAAKADSIAKVEADAKAAAAAKMKADSTKVADSLATLAKGAKKK